MKKPLWLVTGGAGFIGSNIVGELLRRKFRVRVFDNFSTGNKENLQRDIDLKLWLTRLDQKLNDRTETITSKYKQLNLTQRKSP